MKIEKSDLAVGLTNQLQLCFINKTFKKQPDSLFEGGEHMLYQVIVVKVPEVKDAIVNLFAYEKNYTSVSINPKSPFSQIPAHLVLMYFWSDAYHFPRFCHEVSDTVDLDFIYGLWCHVFKTVDILRISSRLTKPLC